MPDRPPIGETSRARTARALVARHGWWIAIAVAYLYVFPYFPRIHSANELPRVYLTRAMVDDGTFAIDRGVRRWGATADVSPARGHQYSNKAPGSSMLAVPGYALLRLVDPDPSLAASVWVCRVVAGILPMLAFLLLLARSLERFAPTPAIRRLVLVAYALGSMAMTYSILFYSHQLGAICIASAWLLALDVADGQRRLRVMLAVGALAGAAPLADYQAVFAALPVAAHVLVRLMRGRSRGELARALGLAVAGASVPIAILLTYHAICFGSPLATGYDASTTFAHFHQQGFLGITQLRWVAFEGSLVRPDNGLFTLAPWLLLALPGGVVLWRRGERGTALVALATAVVYVAFVSSINFWRGGWGVGPRYITALLPFLLPPVAALLERVRARPLVLGALASSIVVGVGVYALAAVTFPYWPDSLANPFAEVTLRMLGDGLVAGSLGAALGVGGVIGVVPYLVLVAGALGTALARAAGARGLVIAVVLGGLILAGYAQLPRSPRAHGERVYGVVRAAVRDV